MVTAKTKYLERKIKQYREKITTKNKKMEKVKLKINKLYGKELILDLYDCNPEIMRSKKKILEYSEKLCNLIKVKRYGKAICERFGFGRDYITGYSLVQLIESSSITGHFSELWNRAFINIFSCKLFDDKIISNFTKKFFKAKKIRNRVLIR